MQFHAQYTDLTSGENAYTAFIADSMETAWRFAQRSCPDGYHLAALSNPGPVTVTA